MPHIHNKTFNITIGVGTTKYNDLEYDMKSDYFQVDELIAVPIQILNRKGYITACCCAGHPFDLTGDFPEFMNRPSFIIENPCESYITFEKHYLFPELPPGFEIDPKAAGTRIVKQYHKNGDYWQTVRDIFETMEQLYLWALNLPDFRG